MNELEIRDKIIGNMAEVIDNKIASAPICDDTKLLELGVNSLSFIKLSVKLEAEFDIEFGNRDLDLGKFPEIKSLVSYIQSKLV